mmetsp:Transcript_52500/g.125439  ORF Transcript_52500/g.125439 Transcript_52500/m.125439 type:complete len:138 (-) Transcript_52500:3-416(-)
MVAGAAAAEKADTAMSSSPFALDEVVATAAIGDTPSVNSITTTCRGLRRSGVLGGQSLPSALAARPAPSSGNWKDGRRDPALLELEGLGESIGTASIFSVTGGSQDCRTKLYACGYNLDNHQTCISRGAILIYVKPT